MDNNHVLSLLGLSLRGGHLVVGEEPVEGAVRARDARVLLLAGDAAANTRRRVEHFAALGQCLWLQVPFTKEELGRAVGRTSAAILALTDIGLAHAVVLRLAQADAAYADAADKLELKARRAAERKAEQTAHEKNLRAGKRKAAPAVAPATPEPVQPPAPPSPRPYAPRSGASAQRSGARPAGGRYGSRSDGDRPAGGGFGRRNDGDRPASASRFGAPGKSRLSKDKRPKPKAQVNPYAHSRPVKKGKGSFRKKDS